MAKDDKNSPLTVWQSIEIFAKAILKMQQELRSMGSFNTAEHITLGKGEELSLGKYEANFKLDKEINIATLPKIGYYILNDELVIHDYITEKEFKVPKEFHYLKVIESPYQDSYRLTFCDYLGNEFFKYKKVRLSILRPFR